MSKFRVRLEIATHKGRETLKTIESAAMPKVGERIDTGDKQMFEVIDVVHTPLIRDWDALVIVKAVQMIAVAPLVFLAA